LHFDFGYRLTFGAIGFDVSTADDNNPGWHASATTPKEYAKKSKCSHGKSLSSSPFWLSMGFAFDVPNALRIPSGRTYKLRRRLRGKLAKV
jgi:hypothetical protein